MASTLKSWPFYCDFMVARLSFCGGKELNFFHIQRTLTVTSIESVQC
jgi:hypothetical protein